MSEENLQVQSNIFIINNVEYIMDSEFDISPRLEDVFTPSELRSGRENSFEFLDLSISNHINNGVNIVKVSSSNTNATVSNIPTFEINDSDEDVIFVSEYANDSVKKKSQRHLSISGALPCPNISRDDSSFSSASSDTTAEVLGTNEPRRNPIRSVRNLNYKKKFGEYITDEDLNVFIASDEEKVDTMNESSCKEIRTRKVVVRNWPAEGLHERPEYNEETGKIEKFDCTIRQIEKKSKKVVLEKPKTLKTPKKKYIPKKFNIKRGKKKTTLKEEKEELVPYEDMKDLINETQLQLSEVFIKTLNETRRKGLHVCYDLSENEENVIERNLCPHQKCLNNLKELLSNQCQLYILANQEKKFQFVNNSLRDKVENFNNSNKKL